MSDRPAHELSQSLRGPIRVKQPRVEQPVAGGIHVPPVSAAAIARHYHGRLRTYAAIRRHLIPRAFWSFVSMRIRPGDRVLDIGCGIGLFTIALAAKHRAAEFLGIDLDARRIAAANKAAAAMQQPNVRFGTAWPDHTESLEKFDLVLLVDVLHHVGAGGSTTLLRRVANELRPRGHVIIKEIAPRPFVGWAFTYALDLLMAPRDCYAYYSEEARAAQMREAGLHDVWTLPLRSRLPYPHYLAVGVKPDSPQSA